MEIILAGREADNKILARNAHTANTFVSRFLGLMFRASFGRYDALVLSPCGSVHTFFMRFAIDVVCTDEAGRVVGMFRNMKPWKVFAPRLKAQTTIELPPHTIRRSRVEPGDVIVYRNTA